MSDSQIVSCETDGCPVLETGRCMEGFEPPADCPHVAMALASDGDEPSELPETDHGDEGSDEQEADPISEDTLELGGGESLTIPLADEVAARHGAQVVLLAGDFQSGKTTLIAELYGQFLRGEYEGWIFAGSDCLHALDGRYHGTRESSGLAHPDTPRTEDEEMRLVDLRLHRGDERLSLMVSDIRGELFDSIVEGGPVEELVPLAPRCDRLIILVDGKKVGNNYQRELAIMRARQLIGGLTESGGVRLGTRTAIVLSKCDLVDPAQLEWFKGKAQDLKRLAEELGLGATEVFAMAARPDASPHEPLEFPPLFQWLVSKTPSRGVRPSIGQDASRAFWSWRR